MPHRRSYPSNPPLKKQDDFEKKINEYRMLWRLFRDILLFVFGLSGLIFETFWAHPVNQPLLVIFAGAMGLPAFLRFDEYS